MKRMNRGILITRCTSAIKYRKVTAKVFNNVKRTYVVDVTGGMNSNQNGSLRNYQQLQEEHDKKTSQFLQSLSDELSSYPSNSAKIKETIEGFKVKLLQFFYLVYESK